MAESLDEDADSSIQVTEGEEEALFIRLQSLPKKSSMDFHRQHELTVGLGRMVLPALIGPIGQITAEADLHIMARVNDAANIREVTTKQSIHEIKEAILRVDTGGNTAAMLAALYNHKEALMALLAPFFVIPHDEDLNKLLHHRNANGQNLMAIVAVHRETLFAAHGLLVEFEAASHGWDSYLVRQCIRNNVGSNAGAIATVKLFANIEERKRPQGRATKSFVVGLKLLARLFILRSLFLLLDVGSDVVLLNGSLDKNQTCGENSTIATYSCGLSPTERYYGTLIVIILPYIFYFFELLQFRTFSAWIEDKFPPSKMTACQLYFLFKPFKLTVNILVLLLYPLIAFFRHFLHQFKYEASDNDMKVGNYKRSAFHSKAVANRAHVIEVCTESSLQPLLQLYLALIALFGIGQHTDQELISPRIIDTKIVHESILDELKDFLDNAIEFLKGPNTVRVVSSWISILVVAISFTSQYRHSKDGIISWFGGLVYFTYICLAVIARILCFEMFTLSLGPGEFWHGIISVAMHVLLMAFVHFFFSKSYQQCQRRSDQLLTAWCRHVLLVLHNCLINGLANIYVHFNLDLRVTYDQETSQVDSRKRSFKYEDASYHTTESRQRTFKRQLVVDLIILVENIIMIALATEKAATTSSKLRLSLNIMVIVSIACYLLSMSLKFCFYWSCHPWHAIIRPRRQESSLSPAYSLATHRSAIDLRVQRSQESQDK